MAEMSAVMLVITHAAIKTMRAMVKVITEVTDRAESSMVRGATGNATPLDSWTIIGTTNLQPVSKR